MAYTANSGPDERENAAIVLRPGQSQKVLAKNGTPAYVTIGGISDDGRVIFGLNLGDDPSNWGTWISKDDAVPFKLKGVDGTVDPYAGARGSNADGSVIVGTTSAFPLVAFASTNNVMKELTPPRLTDLDWGANRTTSDGRIIVGTTKASFGVRTSLVVWDETRNAIDLGTPDPSYPSAGFAVSGVSDDGRLIATYRGIAGRADFSVPWLWREGVGYQTLFDYANIFGISIPFDLRSTWIESMSRDGTVFFCGSTNPDGSIVMWTLTVPGPSVGVAGMSMFILATRRRRR